MNDERSHRQSLLIWTVIVGVSITAIAAVISGEFINGAWIIFLATAIGGWAYSWGGALAGFTAGLILAIESCAVVW